MNKHVWEGQWNEYKGKIKEKWGKLTSDELTEINGKKDILLGKLQKKYGWSEEAANQELDRFEDSLRRKPYSKEMNDKSEKFSKKNKDL